MAGGERDAEDGAGEVTQKAASASCPGHAPACHHGEGFIACEPCIAARMERGPLFCPDDEECGGPGCMDHLAPNANGDYV